MISFRWRMEKQPLHKLVLAADNPRDLLKRVGGFLRSKAKERLQEGEGFPPLASSTRDKYAATRTSAVTKQGKVRAGVQRRMFRGVGDDAERRAKVVEKYKRMIARAKRRGEKDDKRKLDRWTPLGKLVSAFGLSIARRRITVENKVPWSAVHNDGGVAGKGAQIPKRAFLFFGPGDLEEARKIVLDALLGRK